MGISTWQNILNGMPEAVHKAYTSKDSRARSKAEVRAVWESRESFCEEKRRELADGTYTMGDYRHFRLEDRKKQRDISVLPFGDRCVQNCDKTAIEPVILRQMTDDMTGGLPGRGVLSNTPRWCVIRKMQRIMANLSLTHYIQGDIVKFYDSVDNIVAMRIIERYITDRRTRELTRQHLFKQKRLAIGDPFSHLIANLVTSRLVRHLKQRFGRQIRVVNFADDIFIAAADADILREVRREMQSFVKHELRLHYHRLYIRPLDAAPIVFCGQKYTRNSVLLSQNTKKRYVRARHRSRSMGSYNGILEKCDAKYLRHLVERNDNRHMSDKEKIRRPFAGKIMKVEVLEGINHTIVNKAEKPSRQVGCDTYFHVQAVADGFGLIVYSTSSSKLVQYLRTHDLPMRDMVICKDYSGYYYEGTVYTDEEEEEMLRRQYNIPRK